MCGIAGIIGDYDVSDISSLIEKNKHRGPDGTKVHKTHSFCFVHSLLKIMDLSDNSIQPMIDKVTGNIIIFNGSIYNYKDLKKKLFFKDSFNSNTDTEVLLKLYQKFGLGFIEHIKGMFSIAIYDKKINKIYIIKDKYGIKPLYYFSNYKNFIFASEIKTLISHKIIKDTLLVDQNEVIKFIAHRQIHGFKNTLLKNINILEAGHFIDFDLNIGQFKIKKYTTNNQYSLYDKDTVPFETKFDNIISQQSITEHKKIACFMSGGLDSTLLSIILKNQANGKEIHTFSSILNKPNDENKNIQLINKEYNFIEHYVNEDKVNFFEDHIKTIKDMDQPTADASMVVHNVLCREVSKNGFKVLFSGLGGDEIFFGYSIHMYAYLAKILKEKSLREFLKTAKYLSEFTNDKKIILRSFKEILSQNKLNIFKRFQLSRNIKHLDYNFDIKNCDYYKTLSDDKFENIALNYNSHWGLSYFLDYEDKNAMSYGIESRVPYLDYDLANFSQNASLDDHFVVGSKSYLRKHSKMPKYILNYKKKYGFPGNLERYLNINIDKIKEKIFYSFKDVPLININKLINLTNDLKKNQAIFFRTYSYGIWYNNTFK